MFIISFGSKRYKPNSSILENFGVLEFGFSKIVAYASN